MPCPWPLAGTSARMSLSFRQTHWSFPCGGRWAISCTSLIFPPAKSSRRWRGQHPYIDRVGNRLFFFASDPSGEARVGLSLFAQGHGKREHFRHSPGGESLFRKRPYLCHREILFSRLVTKQSFCATRLGKLGLSTCLMGLYGTPIVFIPHLNSFLCWGTPRTQIRLHAGIFRR